MEIFIQLMYLMAFSLAGDSISKAFGLPIPGSVIGMILLFLSLQFNFLKLEKIETVGNFLVNNLPILFVAAGVGIMTKYDLIEDKIVSFLLICVISTIISIAIIGKTTQVIKRKREARKEAKKNAK
ncbi:CidA/LrgA family protein [Oceanivirga miroungae]|uniref:Antiholin-like protein LrgA n=1 Tax=Oceanivirga miroungae TaxID=1130046 RepID=A0A6I8M5X5_9FUSO|nr:CidA/LrgA family protein [Oceanivirga miroungae]VWL84802.1 Antiholin-like protein LrgA [Oceanivirga miroungae]